MTGGKLFRSLIRRRSSSRLVFIRVFSQSGIRALSDWTSPSCRQNILLPRHSPERSSEGWFHLPCTSFHSACSERIPLYDEGVETFVQNQHDLRDTSDDLSALREDKVVRPQKGKRARPSESLGVMKGFGLSMQWPGKDHEGKSVLQSGRQRALKNGSKEVDNMECMVTDSVNKGTEASYSHRRERGNAPNFMHHATREDTKWGRDKAKNNQGNLKNQRKQDETNCRLVSDEKSNAKILDFSDVNKVYEALLEPKQSGLCKHDRDAMAKVFKHFLEGGWASDRALRLYHISPVVFPTAVARFRKLFVTKCIPELRDYVLQLGPSAEADQFLFPLFWEFSSREFSGEIARYKALVETADLTKPHTWFPFARAMKRKVIYHSGPTNSGKTYNAIQRFKAASSGVYCGPLRLLAMEVFDSVNADGVYCSLITGQERKEVPFANHVACTVEMVSLMKYWEVAILDEIQMITDEYRGWAWTRAFLGVPAQELHVCGDPSALKLIRDLCTVTGDDLVEHSYERFKALSIDEQSLKGKYSNVQPGDCIVSFSRKDIFSIKRSVELFTTNRCCVIYGALPPETRTHQARLFNDPNSGYDVLVATDAVGMGLNLNIRRIIFHTLEKYTGTEMKKMPASHVKQIAGRAGRRGTVYEAGVVTTFFFRDMPYLVQCIQEPFVEAQSAGLFPDLEQIELFAAQLPEATFSKLFDRFAETCQVDGSFFLCNHENLKKISNVIDKVKDLTLEDRMSFILAPVNCRDPKVVGALLSFALAYSRKLPIHLAMGEPSGSVTSVLQLMDLEARHHVLSLYLYLSQRFPEEYFPQKEQAEQMATDVALILGESLAQTGIRTIQNGPQVLPKRALRKRSSLHVWKRRNQRLR